VRFYYGKNGKPALTDTFGNGMMHFNLSRSEGLALYAFTRDREIGVDIEHIRDIPEMDEIADQFFSVKENSMYRTLSDSNKKEAFFKCWTRKEAFIKANGEGLGFGLNQFEVSLTPGERAVLISIKSDLRKALCWSLQDLNPGPDLAAALAVQGQCLTIKCWRLK
jgi:4'-phosphopantetheinyl transferase